MSSPTELPSAIVAAESEETRVLLRGLLRMHRHRVVGEAAGVEEALQLVASLKPNVLLAVQDLPAPDVSRLVAEARASAGGMRVVVVGSPSASLSDPSVRSADALLPRPFRVQEFARALQEPPTPLGR